MVLSFDQSGAGAAATLTLADVRQLASSHGVTRADGSADLDAFFRLYGVKALSTFKAKWAAQKLQPPSAGGATLAPVTPVMGGAIIKVRVSSGLAGEAGQRRGVGVGWKSNRGSQHRHRPSRSPGAFPPVRHLTRLFSPQSLEPSVAVACEPLSVTQFQAKSEAAHWDKELKWRLIQRPGGAFIKPDDWYRLHAASMQVRATRA
jgi:hypothetical protein